MKIDIKNAIKENTLSEMNSKIATNGNNSITDDVLNSELKRQRELINMRILTKVLTSSK